MSNPHDDDYIASAPALNPALSVPEGGELSSPPSVSSPSGTPDPVLTMIAQAARDPQINVDKLQQLMALHRQVEDDRRSLIFAEAFADLQNDLPSIDRNGRIIVYSKAERERPGGPAADAQPIQKTPYAQFDDIVEAIRPVLYKHGFSLRFEHDTAADGRLITRAILRHRSGHAETAETPPLQHDSSGSKNNVQAVGSTLTYGKRYAMMAVVPIVSHAPQDRDDDGRAAGSPPIDADQLVHIQQQLRDTGSDVAKFLEKLGAPSVAELSVKQYQRGLELLAEKKRREAQKAKEPAS